MAAMSFSVVTRPARPGGRGGDEVAGLRGPLDDAGDAVAAAVGDDDPMAAGRGTDRVVRPVPLVAPVTRTVLSRARGVLLFRVVVMPRR
jgi:hypothetical protein